MLGVFFEVLLDQNVENFSIYIKRIFKLCDLVLKVIMFLA